MRSKLMYVELKTGYNDNGPAWIGKAFFSKTGNTIYFNGKVFSKGGRGGRGNHSEYLTGDAYWISGVKKDGNDRHWAGNGKVNIDKDVIEEYLAISQLPKLPNDKFEIVELNNKPQIEEFNLLENRKFNPLSECL